MWASGITAAAAVTAGALAVNLVGARSAPDSSPPAPAVASSPTAVGSKSSVPTPASAPASRPGSAIDDFCLNGDSSNPAWGQTHEPYIALVYVHLVQTLIVEPVEVCAWAPTGIAQTLIDSVAFQPFAPNRSPNPASS